MATVWWWIVPASEVNASSRPSDAVLYSTPDSGTQYNALDNGQTITYQGASYVDYQGPFTSQSDARSAPATGGSPIGAGIGAAGAATGNGFLDLIGRLISSNPLGAIAAALGLAVADITDGKMWRSLGWLLLGLMLFIAGVWLWIGRDIPIPVMV